MNHKRGKPKKARAGCLLCKPHKGNHADRRTLQEKRQDITDASEASGAELQRCPDCGSDECAFARRCVG